MKKLLFLLLILLCVSVSGCNKADHSVAPVQTSTASQTENKSPSSTTKVTVYKEMVWIAQRGTKYHRHIDCSNMTNPHYIEKSLAITSDYTACKKCY